MAGELKKFRATMVQIRMRYRKIEGNATLLNLRWPANLEYPNAEERAVTRLT